MAIPSSLDASSISRANLEHSGVAVPGPLVAGSHALSCMARTTAMPTTILRTDPPFTFDCNRHNNDSWIEARGVACGDAAHDVRWGGPEKSSLGTVTT